MHGDIDPSLDTYEDKLERMNYYILMMDKHNTLLDIKMYRINIEYKTTQNTNIQNPYEIRPNYHIHICVITNKEIPLWKFINKFRSKICKYVTKVTFNEKEYPYYNLAYVRKEDYIHESYVKYFTCSPKDEEIYMLEFEAYPESKQDLYHDKKEEKDAHLLDEKNYKTWNAVFTLRNYFIMHEIKYIPPSTKDGIIVFRQEENVFSLKTLMRHMAQDPYFRFHLINRFKNYKNILTNLELMNHYMLSYSV